LQPALRNITLFEGCKDVLPERPYPKGWTWSQNAEQCEQWTGSLQPSGCWIPLYQCAYAPIWQTAVGGKNATWCAAVAAVADCSGRVEGEVLLQMSRTQSLITNQLAFKLAVAEALQPVQVDVAQIQVTAVANVTFPFSQQAARALLQNAAADARPAGVRAAFSVANVSFSQANLSEAKSLCVQRCISNVNASCSCVLPYCLQQCVSEVSEALRAHLEAALNGTVFPTAAVLRLQVLPSNSPVTQSTRSVDCIDPALPPRVQCQDGLYVLEQQVTSVNPGP
jgi:hypothetical protein